MSLGFFSPFEKSKYDLRAVKCTNLTCAGASVLTHDKCLSVCSPHPNQSVKHFHQPRRFP